MRNLDLTRRNVYLLVLIGIILGLAFNSANAGIFQQRMEIVSLKFLPETSPFKVEYKLAAKNCEGGQTIFTAMHDKVYKLGDKVLVNLNLCITPSGDFEIINILIEKQK